MIRRRALAFGGLLGVCAALLVPAGPARACSCSAPDPEIVLARGDAVAIVTRVDARPGPAATFRVERSYGADLPPTVSARLDGGTSCATQVFAQQLVALALRRDGGWVLADCAELRLDEVLSRFAGEPSASSAGPPVAVASGAYGGSALVTLDRYGRPVAWNRRPGGVDAVTACPGGRTVVALGWGASSGGREIAVYDVAGLGLRRAVPVGPARDRDASDLRCDDPGGEVVRLRLSGGDVVSSLVVRGTEVRQESVEAPATSAEPESYLVLRGRRVTRLPAGEHPGTLGLVADAPDGRTAAGTAAGGRVVLFDRTTTRVLARWQAPDDVMDLVWSASGNLVLRTGRLAGYDTAYRLGEIVWLDRGMRVLGRQPAQPGYVIAPIGESVAAWGGTRLGITTVAGTRAVDELWLAATGIVVPLPGAGFVAARPPAAAAAADVPGPPTLPDRSGTPPSAALTAAPASTDGPAAGVAAAVALVIAVGLVRRVVTQVGRRRSRRVSPRW